MTKRNPKVQYATTAAYAILAAFVLFIGSIASTVAQVVLWGMALVTFVVLFFLLTSMWATDWGDDESDDSLEIVGRLKDVAKVIRQQSQGAYLVGIIGMLVSPVLLSIAGLFWLPLMLVVNILMGYFIREELKKNF